MTKWLNINFGSVNLVVELSLLLVAILLAENMNFLTGGCLI
jgi:hypothetical protein